MAKIPKFKTSVSVSQNVPKVEISRNAIGATETAMAQAGGAVAGLGLEIVKQRTKQEAINYSNDQDEAFRREYQDMQQHLSKRGNLSEDGFVTDGNGNRTDVSYASAMNALTKDFRKRGFDEAPTGLAQDTFERSFAPEATRRILQADNAFNNMRISAEIKRSQERGDSKALALLSLPLVDSNTGQRLNNLQDSAADSINQIRKETFITETFKHLSKQQIDTSFKEEAKKVGDVYFDRVLQSDSAIEMQLAVDLIDREQKTKDPSRIAGNSIIKAGFSAKQLSVMKTRLQSALSGVGKENLARLSSASTNLIATMNNNMRTKEGRASNIVELDGNIRAFKRDVVASGTSADKKLQLLAPVVASRAQLDANFRKFERPISEWEKVDQEEAASIDVLVDDLRKLDPTLEDGLGTDALKSALKSQIVRQGSLFNSSAENLKREDAMKFISMVDPRLGSSFEREFNTLLSSTNEFANSSKIRSSLSSIINKMDQNGIAFFDYDIPGKDNTRRYYKKLDVLDKNVDEIENFMNQTAISFGDMFETLSANMNTIEKNDEFKVLTQITSTFSDRNDRKSFIDSYVNRGTNTSAAKQRLEMSSNEFKIEMSDSVLEESKSLFPSLLDGQGLASGNTENLAAIQEVIRSEATKLVAVGKHDNIESAVKESFQKIEKEYILKDALILPRSKYRENMVRSFTKTYKDSPDKLISKMQEKGLKFDVKSAATNTGIATGGRGVDIGEAEGRIKELMKDGFFDNYGGNMVFKYARHDGKLIILHGKDSDGKLIPLVFTPEDVNSDRRSIEGLR